jgi:hypothetical protein
VGGDHIDGGFLTKASLLSLMEMFYPYFSVFSIGNRLFPDRHRFFGLLQQG